MKIKSYTLNWDSLYLLRLLVTNTLGIRLMGIPQIMHTNLTNLATNTLKQNLHGNFLHAGKGHFKIMWVADFGMALRGLMLIDRRSQVKAIIQHMIDESYKRGRSLACYSPTGASDIPYFRADSLPWIFYCVKEFAAFSHDKSFIIKNKAKLQTLLTHFENTCIDVTGKIKNSITGDWMDTIKRPSSTWNNVLALYTYKQAQVFKIHTRVRWQNFEKLLLRERYKNGTLSDFVDTSSPSIDGSVLSMYLKIFTPRVRKSLAHWLKTHTDNLKGKCPMRATYHQYPRHHYPFITKYFIYHYHTSARWIHLGLMYINGLKSLRLPYNKELSGVETVVRKYHNFLETVDDKGNFFRSGMCSEHGFSMSAGQYLEATRR